MWLKQQSSFVLMSCRFLLGVIVRNAKRLQRLADDILDVTRIESKSFTLNKQKLNINEVIVDVIEDYLTVNFRGDFTINDHHILIILTKSSCQFRDLIY